MWSMRVQRKYLQLACLNLFLVMSVILCPHQTYAKGKKFKIYFTNAEKSIKLPLKSSQTLSVRYSKKKKASYKIISKGCLQIFHLFSPFRSEIIKASWPEEPKKVVSNESQPNAEPEEWTCECGVTNKGKFCTNCGKKHEVNVKCPKCGTINEPTAKFCNECGEKLS